MAISFNAECVRIDRGNYERGEKYNGFTYLPFQTQSKRENHIEYRLPGGVAQICIVFSFCIDYLFNQCKCTKLNVYYS